MPAPKPKAVFPFIRQANLMECGTTCLAMIFRSYGLANVRPLLNQLAHVTQEGTNLLVLSQLAELFGFRPTGYRLKPENLQAGTVPLPCIAHYEGNHFVVVYGTTASHVLLADPATGKHRMPRAEFAQKWNGVVLCLEPTDNLFNQDALALVEQHRARRRAVVRSFYGAVLATYRRTLLEIGGASLVLQAIALALPLLTQVIIDNVLVHQNKQLLFVILLAMLGVFGLQTLFTHVRNTLLTQFKVRFELDFFSRFFDHFLHLEQRYFDAVKREELINRFKENQSIRRVLSPAVLQALFESVLVLAYVFLLFYYSGPLAALALLFISLYAFISWRFSPQLVALSNKVFNENGKAMGAFLDALLGIQTIKLLGAERLQHWKWQGQYTRTLNQVLASEQQYTRLTTVLRSVYFLSQGAVYWAGAYYAFRGHISIGQYLAFITIFLMILNALNNLTGFWLLLTELSVVFDTFNDLFAQPREEADLLAQRVRLESSEITLRDVSFGYDARQQHLILRHLNLRLAPGEFVGLVGRNGSGKTTLVKLLAKLYSNYSGEIRVGGTSLAELHPHYYRQRVCLLPQEVHVFNDTLKNNILYGNPGATMEQVIEAAKLADLYDFVKSHYLGFNLMVGENGTALSGGQRLKIAFARLFLSQPDVIILDEASSALDVETEQRIFRNLRAHFTGKTIISIAHRMATLRHADRIVVLEKGEIVEDGPHEQLMARQGVYHGFMKTYLDF